MKKLKKEGGKRKPLFVKLQEIWNDPASRKKADNYFFFGLIVVLVIIGAFQTVSLRDKQSVIKLKEAVNVLSEITKEEQPNNTESIYDTLEYKNIAALKKLEVVIDKQKFTKGARDAKFFKGVVLSKLKRYEEAAKVFETYYDKHSRSPYAPLALMNWGISYELSQDFAKSAEIYKKGLKAFHGSIYEPYFAYYCSLSLEAQGKVDEAAEVLEGYKDFDGEAMIASDIQIKARYFLSR